MSDCITATTSDPAAPTLICIGEPWLHAIGMTRAETQALPAETSNPRGGIIVTPISLWGGAGNGQREVRSLAALPVAGRRLVLVGVSVGYSSLGMLGPVTQLGYQHLGHMVTDLATVEVVLTELARVSAACDPIAYPILAACRTRAVQLHDAQVQMERETMARVEVPPVQTVSGYTIRLTRMSASRLTRMSAIRQPRVAVASCACMALGTRSEIAQAFRGLVTALASQEGVSGQYDVYEGEGNADSVVTYRFSQGVLISMSYGLEQPPEARPQVGDPE